MIKVIVIKITLLFFSRFCIWQDAEVSRNIIPYLSKAVRINDKKGGVLFNTTQVICVLRSWHTRFMHRVIFYHINSMVHLFEFNIVLNYIESCVVCHFNQLDIVFAHRISVFGQEMILCAITKGCAWLCSVRCCVFRKVYSFYRVPV